MALWSQDSNWQLGLPADTHQLPLGPDKKGAGDRS